MHLKKGSQVLSDFEERSRQVHPFPVHSQIPSHPLRSYVPFQLYCYIRPTAGAWIGGNLIAHACQNIKGIPTLTRPPDVKERYSESLNHHFKRSTLLLSMQIRHSGRSSKVYNPTFHSKASGLFPTGNESLFRPNSQHQPPQNYPQNIGGKSRDFNVTSRSGPSCIKSRLS